MAGFNEMIVQDASNDPLIPEPVAAQVIADMPRSSALLTMARKAPMSTSTLRQPVLSVLPQAYWVSPTTGTPGRKQTSRADWENCTLVAEELAVIIPIPETYLEDSEIDVWGEVQPQLATAFGQAVDLAGLFGVSKPVGWADDAIVAGAIAAGNTVEEGDTDDLASDVALMAQKVAEDGFDVNAFASAPGFRWRLIGLRSVDGFPIYAPPAGDQPGTLYGMPLNSIMNGSWDPAVASLIGGDWSKVVIGTRTDIRFKIFTEGVISDDEGAIVLNLMQQDSVALRATMRIGYCVANPATRVNENEATRYPFGVLTPSGS